MAHPSYEVDKTYVAEVDGEVSQGHRSSSCCAGVSSTTARSTVSPRPGSSRTARSKSIVELVIHEGRNRIVRRLLDHVGHPVRRLTRTADRPGAAARACELRASCAT